MRFFISALLFFCPLSALSERLILSPAEKAWLPLPKSQKVRVGDKSLLSLQAEEGQLSLLAKKEGHSLLIAGEKAYEIFILNKEAKQKALELEKTLKGFWGLDWSLAQEKGFQITGRLNRLSDWAELAQRAKSHNILYKFKALPGEGLKAPIKHYFKALFKGQVPPEIDWAKLPSAYIPKGAPLAPYQTALRPYGLIPKEDPLWLYQSPFIKIEIALAEILSAKGLSFGGEAHTGELLEGFSSLLNFLSFLKSSGQGKSLYRSSLIGQSGQKLTIQSGGQIPFSHYNLKTEQKSVQWKPHGLSLSLTPKAGPRGQIELDIQAQISEPLPLGSMDSPPPLKSQSLKSRFVLKEGQILKLFQMEKQSKSAASHGQLALWLDVSNALLGGGQRQKTAQYIFIQAKIMEEKKGE